MSVRVLVGADAREFQRLRLEGLQQCPTAFASHYEEERDTGIEAVATQLEPTEDRVVCGAYFDTSLVGILGMDREGRRNLRHKALLWGMYVTPSFRGKGVWRDLLNLVLRHAEAMPGLRQINLWVNPENESAVALYRSSGFEPVGSERAFLPVDGTPQDLMLMVRVFATS
jgi:RimJ/RimL family protein N-acetyltransferase